MHYIMKNKTTKRLFMIFGCFLAVILILLLIREITTVRIGSAEELIAFSEQVNSGKTYFGRKIILTDDIPFDKSVERNFTPIASSVKEDQLHDNVFSGTFDGKGHIISGVNIQNGSITSYSIGIFGRISKFGTVKNLGVEDSIILGNDAVGAIASSNKGTIKNCYNTGQVGIYKNISIGSVGGLVGENYGRIYNCYNAGEVATVYDNFGQTGGIAGVNAGKIENCYNRGNVSNISNKTEYTDWNRMGYVGGISGSNARKIKNCYNVGLISGNSLVGGISGGNRTSHVNRLTADSFPKINNSFYLNSTAPTGIGFDETGNAEVNSREESEMKKKSFAHQIDIGNFLNQWKQNDNLNDGYPHLHI